jgi:uncharacterized membrane protein YdjX (TVP38/TMEM64 family)
MPSSKKYVKKFLIVLWAALFIGALTLWQKSGIQFTEVPELLQSTLQDFGLAKAAVVYIALYTFRPILFFPATLLTVASGLIFGPWLGILFTIIGENFSANLAFTIARRLGRGWVQSKETSFIQKWDKRLCNNGIVTVLIMRFIYLPFDGVNYGCGLTAMKHKDYAIGTFIGILPGLITFVLLGGTVSAHASGMVMIFGLDISERLFVLLLSIFFFILGLAIAKMIRRYAPEACVA